MKAIPGSGQPHNPFSSERVRPGALPYRFNDDYTIQDLMTTLESARMIGQIIGPHGSGKSTLLRSLAEALAISGCAVELVEAVTRVFDQTHGTILLLESGDRIPPRSIRAAALKAQEIGGGLIATAHVDIGLPTLHRTTVIPELACGIVRELTAESRIKVHDDVVCGALTARDGNLRLALFDLYDWYEKAGRNLAEDPKEIDGIKDPANHK